MSKKFTTHEKRLARAARNIAFSNIYRKDQDKKSRKKIQVFSRRKVRSLKDKPLIQVVRLIRDYYKKHKKDLQNL